ncbi:hypothetical protein CEXT_751041 [Caerostris extrusa]|uniref:Uncharacterized protein n=1 Tax=Caerostris extrusa TaxID=172846 RepID=A0AAV4U0Y7_CAEEX|nr:hypothetical protein CEXT_751041 [Caerostris extrusa]
MRRVSQQLLSLIRVSLKYYPLNMGGKRLARGRNITNLKEDWILFLIVPLLHQCKQLPVPPLLILNNINASLTFGNSHNAYLNHEKCSFTEVKDFAKNLGELISFLHCSLSSRREHMKIRIKGFPIKTCSSLAGEETRHELTDFITGRKDADPMMQLLQPAGTRGRATVVGETSFRSVILNNFTQVQGG